MTYTYTFGTGKHAETFVFCFASFVIRHSSCAEPQ